MKRIETLQSPAEQKCLINVTTEKYTSFVLLMNHIPVIKKFTVKNLTEDELTDLKLVLNSESELLEVYEEPLEKLGPGRMIRVIPEKLNFNHNYLASVDGEKEEAVTASVMKGEEVYGSVCFRLHVLTFEQWTGSGTGAQNLASFVTPAYRAVRFIRSEAEAVLRGWGIEMLQLREKNYKDHRIPAAVCRAVYKVLQGRRIPAEDKEYDYENAGLRIRPAGSVVTEQLCAGLDMACLYASVLESLGVHPVIAVREQMVFAGGWLTDECYEECTTTDPAVLTKRTDLRKILLFNCAGLCAGTAVTMEEACREAVQVLRRMDTGDSFFAVDIFRCRKSGIRSLPERRKDGNGFIIDEILLLEGEKQEEEEKISLSESLDDQPEVQAAPRYMTYMENLLGNTNASRLISMRLNRSVIPVVAGSIPEFLKAVSERKGDSYDFLPCPEEWEEAPFDGSSRYTMENTHLTGRYEELIRTEQRSGRIHTVLGKNEFLKASADLAAEERTSIEERGVDFVYITLGLLRWYDVDQKNIARYAPLILIPAEIWRASGRKTRKISFRQDEEPRFNETMAWRLRRELGISLRELESLPFKNGVIDYDEVRRIVLTKIKDARNWVILDGVFISSFNFANFTIWKELKQRRDFFMKSPAVRSLVLGINEIAQPPLRESDPSEIRLPMILDSSQTEAVRKAACGWSMIMNGPPGTGKSQTITAILLWAVSHGKKVLFVAEKKAALDIVKNRMKQLGFGEFCLLLQPEKSFRGRFLEQMKKLLELAETKGTVDQEAYRSRLSRFLETEEEVGHYAGALHKKLACGRSLWELICLYETIDAPVTLSLQNAAYARDSMEEQARALQILIDAGSLAGGGISHHPLKKIEAVRRPLQLSRRLRKWIPDCLALQEKAAEALKELEKEEFCPSGLCLKTFGRICEALENIKGIPCGVLLGWESGETRERVSGYLEMKSDADGKKKELEERYGPDLAGKNLEKIADAYKKACTTYFGFLEMPAVSRNLRDLCGRKVDDPAALLDSVQAYENAVRRAEQYRDGLSEFEKNLAGKEGGSGGLQEISECIERFYELSAHMPELQKILADERTFTEGLGRVEAVRKVLEEYEASWEKMEELLEPAMDTDRGSSWTDLFAEREDFLHAVEENLSGLSVWIDYRNAAKACRDLFLGEVVDYYEEEDDGGNLINIWKKSVCENLIWDAVDEDEFLCTFSGNTFSNMIRIFREIDEEMMKAAGRKMYRELVNALPVNEDSPEISEQLTILRKAIQVRGAGISIRETILKIPDVLLRLCPCMMMSPAAVSQYLPPDKNFDMVLFDEASQVETCKAIPALARADQFIVVGDHQQMPPSRDFRSGMESEDIDYRELPSILDDIEVLGVPRCELLWHYRSRHESLIAFSNHMFYGNRLMTFPSANDRERRVIYKWVGGRFESGGRRINKEEAAAVAAEIRRRYEDPALREQSVGVVTFNAPQQALVRELVADMAAGDSDFDAWANDRKEPLFIKNLENVQGDERDVILFSTAFSAGEKGTVNMQFGPVSSSDNGYKRLNVAITRTRCELLVFSSMKPEQLSVTETTKPGARALRDFLAYARDGVLPAEGIYGERTPLPVREKKGAMAEKICRMLDDSGFSYDTDVGRSSMRVDIGVIDPYHKDRYMLGILLDTPEYGAISNVRDREIGRDDVLKGLGWNICHIRAMDWWDDSGELLKKLRKQLLALKEELDPGLPALPGPGRFLEDKNGGSRREDS